MKKLCYFVLAPLLIMFSLAAGLLLLPVKPAPFMAQNGPFAIERVNVVNVESGAIDHAVTVLVDGGEIVDILPAEEYREKPYFNAIPADNQYLIPGLWDMHTHSLKLSPQIHHPLFIANGVTAARDLSGCMNREDSYWACIDDRIRWTNEALSGTRVSPRYILQSSYQTNGGNEVPDGYPSFFRLGTKADADALVAFYKSIGADFVKVYSELSLEQYLNLAAAARANAVDIAGHKPIVVPLLTAIESGQKSIEHARLFLFDCYAGIGDFRRLHDPIGHYTPQLMWEMLAQQDPQKCRQLMAAMGDSDTWWVPTLTTLRMSAYANDPGFRGDSRLQFVPFIVKRLLWYPDADRAATRGYSDTGEYVHRDFYRQALSHVNEASQQGVKLLAGTDVGDTYVFAGSGLHDELTMLVDSGLTPLEALRSATISAAIFSGLDDQFGSIQVGKVADFVLLEDNPLQDIGNIRRIAGVMQNGFFFDRSAIDELKLFVEKRAGSLHVNLRFLWNALYSPLMRKQLAD